MQLSRYKLNLTIIVEHLHFFEMHMIKVTRVDKDGVIKLNT